MIDHRILVPSFLLMDNSPGIFYNHALMRLEAMSDLMKKYTVGGSIAKNDESIPCYVYQQTKQDCSPLVTSMKSAATLQRPIMNVLRLINYGWHRSIFLTQSLYLQNNVRAGRLGRHTVLT